MANIHGLDFLRKEHTLKDDGVVAFHRPTAAAAFDEPRSHSTAAAFDLETLAAQVAMKPNLEKQFDVIHFLQAHRSSGYLAPSVIYQRTGIDLQEDEVLADMLQHNPKIRIELVPDPENPSLMLATYAYQAKYNYVRDRTSLLAQINRCNNGVPRRDLEDAYDGVDDDLDILITAGDVLAVQNTEDKTQILFPRGEAFWVELDGVISIGSPEPVRSSSNSTIKLEEEPADGTIMKEENQSDDQNMPPPNPRTAIVVKEDPGTAEPPSTAPGSDEPTVVAQGSLPALQHPSNPSTLNENPEIPPRIPTDIFQLETDIDPQSQIRRGEAIQIGGHWFRVSSAVKEGSIKDQPARAQAPLSVVMLQDLSKRNEPEYIRGLTDKILPVDTPLSKNVMENLAKAKEARERLLKVAHGRSGGIASQLLGSHAHASNPTTLAASFGTASMTGGRQRPHHKTSTTTTTTTATTSTTVRGGKTLNDPMRPQQQQQQQQQQKEKPTDDVVLMHAKEAASDPYLALYSHARRHGCTKDVRQMYLDTRSFVPESDVELKRLLLKHKLLEPGEEMRRPRLKRKANVDNDGKPKKKRYYEPKKMRMTNTHLEGTEIGVVLRRAQEKQQQGESVGDGGM